MAQNQSYNVCTNWGLRCFEQKVTEKSVILKCSINRRRPNSNEYTAPVYIDVVCMFDSCEIAQDDYTNGFINVDGQFSVSDYTNKSGAKIPTMSIFASKVTKKA